LRRVVIGMAEAQHLDHMLQRPFDQAAAILAQFGLQRQRAGTGPLGWTADPKAGSGGAPKRAAARAAVAQDAVAGLAGGNLERRVKAQLLEGPDAGMRRACLVGDRFQL